MKNTMLFTLLMTSSLLVRAESLEIEDLINKYYAIKSHDTICELTYNYAPVALMKRHLNKQTLGEMLQDIQNEDDPSDIKKMEMEVLMNAPPPEAFSSLEEVKLGVIRFKHEQFIECRKKLL